MGGNSINKCRANNPDVQDREFEHGRQERSKTFSLHFQRTYFIHSNKGCALAAFRLECAAGSCPSVSQKFKGNLAGCGIRDASGEWRGGAGAEVHKVKARADTVFPKTTGKNASTGDVLVRERQNEFRQQ